MRLSSGSRSLRHARLRAGTNVEGDQRCHERNQGHSPIRHRGVQHVQHHRYSRRSAAEFSRRSNIPGCPADRKSRLPKRGRAILSDQPPTRRANDYRRSSSIRYARFPPHRRLSPNAVGLSAISDCLLPESFLRLRVIYYPARHAVIVDLSEEARMV